MGIAFRNGVDEMGIKTAGEMGIDEMESYQYLPIRVDWLQSQVTKYFFLKTLFY